MERSDIQRVHAKSSRESSRYENGRVRQGGERCRRSVGLPQTIRGRRQDQVRRASSGRWGRSNHRPMEVNMTRNLMFAASAGLAILAGSYGPLSAEEPDQALLKAIGG